ncbi:protein mono-ADP-ribosyltransferase PARP14-like [Ruditapes philippinarum]|uniref:protein mono-ADP-ribosyltransferase PARP14-like n=1 Tax=Ruditapes philippinarum TaxID=129788 RepID=UPI00295ABB48|nr:protein mono-ADP-ribosyltransferase PARP14-like [Ruditapes philippinarum]
MTSKETLVTKTVLLKEVPECVTLEQISTYINSKTAKGKVEKHVRQFEEDNGEDSNTWILLMNSVQAVDDLVNEEHEGEFENISFERATETSVPKEWLFQLNDNLGLDEYESQHDGSRAEKKADVSGTNETPFTLRIRGLPADTNQQYLDLYFNDDDLFGDCKICKVSLETNETSALIYLESKEDLEKIKEMAPLDMDGTMVSVEEYTSVCNEEPTSVHLHTIEVTGPPNSSIISERNKSLLSMYFKNSRKSEGGKISEIKFESNKALIQFETEEVAQRVVEKESHRLSGVELTVKLYNPPIDKIVESEHEQTSIVLSNLPESIDAQYIELFFDDEEIFGEGLEVLLVTFNDDHSSAIVEFKDKDAAIKVLNGPSLKMEDREIKIQTYLPEKVCKPIRNGIEVHGPQHIVSDTNIKMLKKYFESQRFSGGSEIIDSSICPGLACFTYVSEEVARRVVDRKHTFKNHPLDVNLREMNKVDKQGLHPSADKSLNTINVLGIPKEIDKEYLIYFFENLDDDIEVKELSLCDKSRRATIEFSTLKAVQIVMDKKPLNIKGTELIIEQWKPMKMCTISVQGPDDIQQYMDKLELYFKNRKSGGNSKIIDSWVDMEKDAAFFTYEEEAVAKNVVQKGQHRLGKQKLNVRLCTETMRKDTSNEQDQEFFTEIKLQNLPKQVTETHLKVFLEGQDMAEEIAEFNVVNVDLRPGNDSAIIELDNPEVAKLLCERRTLHLKDVEVSVERFIPRKVNSCTIAVSGLPRIDEQLELLEMYFKGKRSKGNSQIVNKWVDQKRNEAYFTYQSKEVAERVAAKTDHVFDRHTLNVSLFTEDNMSHDLTKKIRVSKLPDDITEMYLQTLFEQQEMPFDFNVVSVILDSKEASAIIEFDCPEAVSFMLTRKPITIKGKEIEIKYYVEQCSSLCSIEVTGIPNIEDHLAKLFQYFNNSHKSRGGKIVEYYAEPNSNKAYFTFESGTVAERVLLKDHSQVWKGIQLSLVRNNKHEEDEVPSNMIRVSGIRRVARETLKYYFENKLASGGGSIAAIEADQEDEDVIYIQFSEKEVAECVAGRSHEVEGQTIKTRIYKSPPYYDTKVLVKGIALTTTKDSIFNFLEAKTGIKVLQIAFSEEDDNVIVVTMEKPPDFTKFKEACRLNTLEGARLTIDKIPISSCIYLANISPEITEDTLRYYFESKFGEKGKVDKVLLTKSEGICLVYFENYKVVNSVLEMKHTLGGRELKVSCYQNLLKGTEETHERVLKVPNPIDLSNTAPEIIQFCHTVPFYRTKFEKEMSEVYANIVWPKKPADKTFITCTLDLSVRGCFKHAKTWQERVEKKITILLADLSFTQIDVHTYIWEKLIGYVRTISVDKPQDVQIYQIKEKNVINIVGRKEVAEEVKQKVLCENEKLEQEYEKDRQKVREYMRGFQPIEVRLMNVTNTAQVIQQHFDDLTIEIDDEENAIIFEGPLHSVKDAQIKFYEMKNNFGRKEVELFSDMLISMYQSKEAVSFIQNLLQESGLQALWEIRNSSLIVCCTQNKMLEKCAEIILTSLAEERIEYNAESVPDMKADSWRRTQDNLRISYKGNVEFSTEENIVIVCATKDILATVISEVNRFIDSKTILSKFFSFPKDVIRLIEKHHKSDITAITLELSAYHVEILMAENYSGMQVHGLVLGVEKASMQLQKLCNRVKKRKHTIRKPGVADYIGKAKGKDNINTVETVLKCIVSIEGGDQGNKEVGEKRVAAECTFLDGRVLFAFVGDMTELEVDMIINPDDEKIHFHGGLGRAIISKGGASIKKECEDFIKENGDLAVDDVFVSEGGNLNAKYVSHILSHEWRKGTGNQIKTLGDSVFNCLTEATKRRLSSIAIPAIGCGVNGFPPDIATETIIRSVKQFFLEVQHSPVTEVYVCDYDEKKVQCFTNALCSEFGRDKVSTFSRDPQPLIGNMNKNSVNMTGKKKSSKSKISKTKDADVEIPILKILNGVQIGKLKVKIVKGEISSEKVNVIVNSTSSDLTLANGAVSISLLNVAGKKMQEEVRSKYPNGLNNINIAITSGYKLKCKHVYHTALDQFDANKEMECRKRLFDLISECLEEADNQGNSSIALPAFGTGQLDYPQDVVAEEMYKAVITFGRTGLKKKLHDVRFVLYYKDDTCIQAFENEESKILRNGISAKKGDDFEDTCYELPSNDSESITRMFGRVTLTVKLGDLLAEKAHCIVNSTNVDLDLSVGAVSKVILQQGGQMLQAELDRKKNMMKSEFLVVTSAPNLPSNSIMHIVVNTDEITETVLKCLEEAEQQKMTSLAFPALGTGMNTSDSSTIGRGMVDAVEEFSNTNPKHLKDVRFVVFQRPMLRDFIKVAYDANDIKSKKGLIGKLWSNVKGVFSGSYDNDDPNKSQKDSSQDETDVNKVTFYIYSLGEDEIDKAIRKLDSFIEKEVESKTFTDYIIQQLDEDQVSEVTSIAKHYNIDIKIDQQSCMIKICGMKDNFFKAYDKIQSFIKDAIQMDYMSNIAQWYVIEVTEDGEDVQPYERDLNLKIETRYKQNAQEMGYTGVDGRDYIINFEAMEEYPETDKTAVAKVLRRNVVKGGSFDIPPNWGDMQGGNLRVIDLKQDAQEYIEMKQKFLDSASSDYEVLKIQKIQNKTLWEQYQSKRNQLEARNKPETQNERMLWHGTKAEAVDSINIHGFNRSFCGQNAVAFGYGVYFAVEADYSCDDTYSVPDANDVKRIYYSRVLTGEYTTGVHGLRQPPAKPVGGPHNLYDSVIDDPDYNQMFVVFNDTQAYPEYLIFFK